MHITGYIWREETIDKLAWKHDVQVDEVIDVFENRPRFERLERVTARTKISILLPVRLDQVDIYWSSLFARQMTKRWLSQPER